MINTYFILNKQAHYFVVNGDIDTKELSNCDLFSSLSELVLTAAKVSEVDLDVVEDNVHYFTCDAVKNEWKVIEPKGFSSLIITENIEQYLSDWSL